ncbi:DNA excision repair protein ERCC-1-like [Stegodyphus dumicola]|uniref:DNA excision repair protein ERCC-1-like n=1 Tax=Stegodyphus dumicola TaxID=202533 RepID=UPI0015B15BBD|nr:DNA excision repair protein ERCC-1-like [Stegodyphus dumicola]
MESSPNKFCIPQNIDDSFEEPSSAPQYFKPGIILQEANKTNGKVTINASSSQNTSTVVEEGSTSNDINTTVHSDVKTLSPRKPASRFESEFGHLRESKYYDKSVETASSDNQGKSSGKGSSSALLVNPRQRGNPLLKSITNVPWEFSEIEPDYVMGKTACALFLSLRYHNLFPNYIHERLKALGKTYSLRVLLVQVDVAEPNPPLKDLSVIAILADCTLMVSWSAEEAGNYLETYKMFENKSADLIKEKQDNDNYSQLIDCLTTIRSVNKTDAMVLLSTFKTLKGIIQASIEELAACPGFGPLKAKRLYEALRKPLRNEAR